MPAPHGRGAGINPAGRFERLAYEVDAGASAEAPAVPTRLFTDAARSIIAYNDSPDVGFDASINPYRGCEHGCVYCYARPNHEYLGFSAGIDFETKILVKEDAPALLRRELASRGWKPQTLGISGVTDPYQPIERKLRLTRQCLEVLLEFRNPFTIITKNALVTRDADLIAEMARYHAASVFISVTTLNGALARDLEPRASQPDLRLDAIRQLSAAGIPVGVLVAPVIPAITDHEIPAILEAVARAGATVAGYVMLRLPYGVKDLFAEWLDRHFPERKEKVLHRIQSIRGGRMNDIEFHQRMRGSGAFSEEIQSLFRISARKFGLHRDRPVLSVEHFRRPSAQGVLFD